MFEYIMSEDRHSLLKSLSSQGILQNFYLAGGTATALYLGHRWSEDLDFFTPETFDPMQLVTKLAHYEDFVLTGQAAGTLHCFINEVKVSFLYYPYPQVEAGTSYHDVQLASLTDIALMKIIALIQRGTKKDFVDLYFLDRQYKNFETLLQLYSYKYQAKTLQPVIFLKALGYFEEAETEPMPRMFRQVSWSEVKAYFLKRQKALSALLLG